jgi:hypothetical protein
MAPPKKDLQSQLDDAVDLLRKKNAELVSAAKTIKSLRRENDTADAIRQEIFGLSSYQPIPVKWITGSAGKIGRRGCPITVWSDWHVGEQVNMGINKFNAKIARERALRLFDTTADLAFNHMGRAVTSYPGIIVCLGGDMIGGDIHEELAETNDRTPHQAVNDLTDLLAGGIEYMATKFGQVYVPCVVGNHGRSTKKPRYKGRVYTNYDWSVYCNLERAFRKEKHIKIDVPNSLDCHFNSYGIRYMLTHGDDLGVKGGDGIIGALGPIARGTIKVNNQMQHLGQDVDHIIICHWHQPLWLPSATVNNALKGPDEYSMFKLRAPPSTPSQLLWFNHPEWGITARWEIFLEGKIKFGTTNAVWASWQENAP